MNFAPITRFSLEWYAISLAPSSSTSRVMRKADRFSVF